jgi:hypothetical protein
MNPLEAIIEKEKAISYSQRDKGLFRSHILILIHQEKEIKRVKRKLGLVLFLAAGTLSLFPSQINEIANDFTVGLSDAMTVDPLTTLVFSYGLMFALLALLKKTDFIFSEILS